MKQPTVVALGFFDGVHLGHAALLQKARARADELGLPATAISFHTPPQALVTGATIPLLTTCEDRAALLRAQGMDGVVFLPFDRTMMAMPWETFFHEILLAQLGAAWLVCGHDYRFGFRGEGTPAKLQVACAGHGIGCDVIEKVELDGKTVSSSAIRKDLARGDVAQARHFLGRPFFLTGEVVHGSGLGRTIGTPTANLHLAPGLMLPKEGVYISRAITAQGAFPSVTNIGCRPTVDAGAIRVETWLPDYQGDLYGQHLRLELWEYLRTERKFDNMLDLRTEIIKNAAQTRAYFAELGSTESEERI